MYIIIEHQLINQFNVLSTKNMNWPVDMSVNLVTLMKIRLLTPVNNRTRLDIAYMYLY